MSLAYYYTTIIFLQEEELYDTAVIQSYLQTTVEKYMLSELQAERELKAALSEFQTEREQCSRLTSELAAKVNGYLY